MLNQGLDGLRNVFDQLASGKDPAFDEKMLEDAIDHVSYEEEIEEYAKKVVETSNNPLSVKFAKEILEDFDVEYDDYEDDDEDEDYE